MSGKFGGGGTKCTVCDKTAYPAETIQLEKKPYHVECFKCKECDKKMEGAAKASPFEGEIYCHSCFKKCGFAQKQKKTAWVKKESTGSAIASKFGGGGNPCTICEKTVYPAETVQFEKQVYHAGCFACMKCSKALTPSGAAKFEAEIMCTKCFSDGGYNRKQAASGAKSGGGSTNSALASKFGGGGTKCEVCTKTVYPAEQVSFDKKAYHADCFACTHEKEGGVCGKKITPSQANNYEGKIICTKCFGEGGYRSKQAKVTGNKTAGATSSKFSSFGGGGNKCVRCDKTVYPAETVSFEKNFFHADCFKCMICEKKMSTSECEGKKKEDGGVDTYCKKCWKENGLGRAQLAPKEE